VFFTTLFGCSKNESNLDEKSTFEQSYLSSKSFSKVKETYDLSISNLKFDKSFSVPSGKDVDILIIPVFKGNVHSAYLWVYKKENGITTLYESLTFDNSILSYASLYSESKLFIMDIEFKKEKAGLRYTIVDGADNRSIAKKAASSKIAKTPPEEGYTDCVTRVYQTAKKACESDPTCDTLCDVTPGCHTSMLAAAAYTCL